MMITMNAVSNFLDETINNNHVVNNFCGLKPDNLIWLLKIVTSKGCKCMIYLFEALLIGSKISQ